MSNQMIGIAGVFALTFFLLVVLHFLLSLGQRHRNHYVNPDTNRVRDESNVKTVEDDSWLLWSPDSDSGSPTPYDEPTGLDRTLGDKGRHPRRFPAGH